MGSCAEVIIMGVDPGRTTGVAVIAARRIRKASLTLSLHVPIEDAPRFFEEMIYGQHIDLIAIERFTISQRTIKVGRDSSPLDVIGGVKWLASLADPAVPYVMQAASDAKTAYTNETLEELGVLPQGRHAQDAARHAMLATHTMRTR